MDYTSRNILRPLTECSLSLSHISSYSHKKVIFVLEKVNWSFEFDKIVFFLLEKKKQWSQDSQRWKRGKELKILPKQLGFKGYKYYIKK